MIAGAFRSLSAGVGEEYSYAMICDGLEQVSNFVQRFDHELPLAVFTDLTDEVRHQFKIWSQVKIQDPGTIAGPQIRTAASASGGSLLYPFLSSVQDAFVGWPLWFSGFALARSLGR
jgi:hypothetical protein